MTSPLPHGVRTLGGMFDHAARQHPAGRVGTTDTEECVSFGQLARDGRAVARNLVAAGIGPGTPVAVLGSGIPFLQAVDGIATAGAVVVPLPVPIAPNRAHLARLHHVLRDSGVRHAVVEDRFAEGLAGVLPDVRAIPVSRLLRGQGDGPLPAVQADDVALVQYTSGSTSDPHGVALTHRNVLAGIRALHAGTRATADDVLCHWLPLSHDMGLFSTLAALAAGMDVWISTPWNFVKQPAEWLRRFCELRATVFVGPDFSYRYLLEAIPPDTVADYDLSGARVLLNGAEPVDPALVTAFGEHFAAAGLAPQAMTPCYGLAEATLAVSIAPPESTLTVDWVDRRLLNSAGLARPVARGGADARGVVNCGPPVPGIEVRIVEDGTQLPDRHVGSIEIRGVPVMRGYYREDIPSVAADGWCPTGDLGYLADSCVHVTGRTKEMLIIGGRNHYPQDVEALVRGVPGVHQGRAVAVVLPADPHDGRPERIAVLAEVADPLSPFGAVVSGIRQAAAESLGGAAVDTLLLRRGALLRTTSGKFQRLLMRRQLLAGTLDGILARVPVDEPAPRMQTA